MVLDNYRTKVRFLSHIKSSIEHEKGSVCMYINDSFVVDTPESRDKIVDCQKRLVK